MPISIKHIYKYLDKDKTLMAYDHNMINNYDHLQDSPSGSHLGSKNSNPHLAGGNAGYTTSLGGAREHNPGGATQGKVGSGKPTKNDNMGNHKETKGPGGMDM